MIFRSFTADLGDSGRHLELSSRVFVKEIKGEQHLSPWHFSDFSEKQLSKDYIIEDGIHKRLGTTRKDMVMRSSLRQRCIQRVIYFKRYLISVANYLTSLIQTNMDQRKMYGK